MDFLEAIFGSETEDDRLAESNLAADRAWLEELVQLRKSKGLRQEEVGAAMGISQSAVARIESGTRDLHQSSLRRYAIAVGAEVRHVVNAHVPGKVVDIPTASPVEIAPLHPTAAASESLAMERYA